MNWQKLLNPIAWLKGKLREETKKFQWSDRERDALINAGKTLEQVHDSEECIKIAGASWMERTVK